jgi:hypothetical protein
MTTTNFPPRLPMPAPGTQTSDRWGNVISTRPLPVPVAQPSQPSAPTSDRWGHVISAPVTTPVTKPSISSMPPVKPQPAPGTQTSDRWGNVISTRLVPAPFTPVPASPSAPTSDRWGHVIDWK